MLSKEEYFSFYYEKGKTIDQIGYSKNNLNERQLESKYKKYCKKNERKDFSIDQDWIDVREEVFERDKNTCQLLNKLPYTDTVLLKENSGFLCKIIDPAHIFNKASYPSLKYNSKNIVCLNRWSHICLDNLKHPIFGTPILKEEREIWWEFIVGKDRIDFLKNLL